MGDGETQGPDPVPLGSMGKSRDEGVNVVGDAQKLERNAGKYREDARLQPVCSQREISPVIYCLASHEESCKQETGQKSDEEIHCMLQIAT